MISPKPSALVFGASGITGWAIARTALEYPTPTTFSRVIGLTNRPLSLEDSGLPPDPRLSLKSGVDLSGDIEATVKALAEIKGIEEITHVYFTAYVHKGWGHSEEATANVDILLNSLKAVERLCPNLQFVTWASGGKWYGHAHFQTLKPKAPFRESDARVPPPLGEEIFYYNQFDAIASYAKGKKWNFADIRPDAVIGFVPNNNPMNLAQPIGLYLSLWSTLNPGKPVPFPGTAEAYSGSNSLHTSCFQDQAAKLHIFASLHPEKTAGGSFNIADSEVGTRWEDVWPGLCAYFGLKASGPVDGVVAGEEWVRGHEGGWSEWEKKHGVKQGVLEGTIWGIMSYVVGEYSEWDRSYDISLAREIGFSESIDHVEGYRRTFDRMVKAKMMPPVNSI